MRAMGFHSFGSPDVLRLIELDKSSAASGEVRIRIKAAGVLPFDCRMCKGWIPPGVELNFPVVLGNEFAGIIDQLGDGVTDFSVGQEVLGFGLLNSYAEYLDVRSDQIVLKPKNMPWDVAGGFSGNGQGAHMALGALGIGEGDTVLIHAAAGGLGSFAVQLAKIWGAKTVIGTASLGNHDYLRSLGAIPASYGDGLVDRVSAIAPDGIDAVLDAAGPEALQASMQLVKDKLRVRTMVSFDLASQLRIRPLKGERSAATLKELVDLYSREIEDSY